MELQHQSMNHLYRTPFGSAPCGSEVTLRLEVHSDGIPQAVYCVWNDTEVRMYFRTATHYARIYECRLRMPDEPQLVWYYFYADADGTRAYYGNNEAHLGGVGMQTAVLPTSLYQITVYDPAFKTPDWMKHAVVYQIFPDRFCRVGDTPFHGIPRAWGDEPFFRAEQFGGEYLSNDFFGGNLEGILAKLPYLQELGITAIYLNPIFQAFSNHRYDTADYEKIDPLLGDNETFERLAAAAKKHGIRLILDGVFSHTGADSRYFNRYGNFDSVGAYQSEDSPYHSWYHFMEFPNIYESWWGFQTLPNTCEMDASFRDFVLQRKDSVIKQWIERGASGWRLDVADELPDEFICELRRELKKKNPDALLLGEVWEDASNKISYDVQRSFLWGRSLDSVMNYVMRSAVLDYLVAGNATLFAMRLWSMTENYPKESLYTALNLLSGHDVPRAMTILSGAPDVHTMTREEQASYRMTDESFRLARLRMRLAVAIQMTLPGAPCVYYGDEACMTGYADPFNRRCYPWGAEDREMQGWFKSLIALRRKNPALETGEFLPIFYFDNLICYLRLLQGGVDAFGKKQNGKSCVVMVNSDTTSSASFMLGLGRFGALGLTDAETGENVPYDFGAHMEIPPLSYRVLLVESEYDA